VIAGGIFLYFNFFALSGKASLNLKVVPSDAKVSINGEEKDKDVFELKPGKYDIEVWKEDYETYKKSIHLGEGEEKEISIQLKFVPSRQVLKRDLLSYFLNREENIVFYMTSNKDIYRLDGDQEEKVGQLESGDTVFKVKWSSNDSKLIVDLEVIGGSLKKVIFSEYGKKIADYDEGMKDVDFFENGNKIIYVYGKGSMYYDDDFESNLSVSELDGSNWKVLASLTKIGLPFMFVSPSSDLIALSSMPGGGGGDIYVVGVDGKNIKQITSDGYSIYPVWSLGGDRILYNVTNNGESGPSLWLMNKNGSDKKSLDVNTTTDKCAWKDPQNLICAVPKNYSEDGSFTEDALYAINIDTGEKTLIEDFTEGKFDIESIQIDNDENIYFINKYDKSLYRLKTKP